VRTLLSTMHELDLVQKFVIPAAIKGRPTTRYVRTEYLKNDQLLVDVMRKVGIE
jgi:hypothetical protein